MKLGSLALVAVALFALASSSSSSKGKPKGKGVKLSKGELVDLARAAGFPDPNLAAAVALAESGGDPSAVGVGPKERSIGLWQINIRAWKKRGEEELKQPATNAQAAFEVWSTNHSFAPHWGAYTNGSYKKFL